MALPISIPNTFATETNNIPLSELDTNFTTVANAINGIGSGLEPLANVVITGGTITNVTANVVSISNATITGGTIANVTFSAGTAAAPAITTTGDTNTGMFFPAADTIAFAEGGVESMRLNSSGNLGIGTSSPATKLHLLTASASAVALRAANSVSYAEFQVDASGNSQLIAPHGTQIFNTNGAERMRIDSAGNLLVGRTALSETTNGITFSYAGESSTDAYMLISSTRAGGLGAPMVINRQSSDGILVSLRQANTQEGTISVSGTTVSYNGGHLARFAQTVGSKDESLLKGTVLSNLDEMNTYVDEEGNPAGNEQLNKVKVSDVEGDADVAGVFVNWSYDEQHSVDEINMAMTGDMVIRVAQGVTVARGDLLMSAGNGTAKPQGDDIVRSKTIAKVTSTNVTCTYADGSYCVPCVLMAC